MRHLRAVVIVITVLLATVTAAPGASAQAPLLESCSYDPVAVTIRPGEVAETLFSWAPVDGEALLTLTFDGDVVSTDPAPFPDESPIVARINYDDLTARLSDDLGRPVTDGVAVLIYRVGLDDPEELCSLTMTLTTAPEPSPTTTTTTLPTTTTTTVTEAAPRFTG